MTETMKNKISLIKFCAEEIKKLPMRIGASVYVRVGKKGNYQMLDIKSQELYNFMFTKMLNEHEILLDKAIWKQIISYILGDYTLECMTDPKNRIGIENDVIYYDILDINAENPHYVKISAGNWEVVTGSLNNYDWNPFQKSQKIPLKGQGNIEYLWKYINLQEDDKLMFLIYVISCFVPHIQHPILNICDEHNTGKSTLSKIIKGLVDPSKTVLNDFSDNEDGIRIPLSLNYLTVFDNTEDLPKKLNPLFCRAVTGGETMKRKHYTTNEMVAIPLKSIVVMNGITSAIRREDLMSRTVFVETAELKNKFQPHKLEKAFEEDKPKILAGIFDILAEAMKTANDIELSESYRMNEFATWGYAISEALGKGKGTQFLKLMKKNEHTQLQETYANEPLIILLSNYMILNKGEDVCMLTSRFFEKVMNNADTYLGSGSNVSKRALPKTSQAFTKKVNSLKSVFKKLGIIIEIDRTGDVRNLSQISISMADNNNSESTQNNVEETFKETLKREPIIGIRKPFINIRKPILLSDFI